MQSVKGTSLELTIELVRRRHGDEGIRELHRALPEDVRDELPPDLRVLPTNPYPFRTWAEVLLAAESLLGKPLSIARESARSGYRTLLSSTYANWVRRGEPLESVRRLPLLWDQVTKGLGTYEVIERGPQSVAVRLRLAVEPAYRAITEERCAGVVEAMIEAAGARGQVRIVRSPEHTDLEVTVRGASAAMPSSR